MTPFSRDDYPGRPRILFIGFAESTHTHAWIDLLKDADFNIRLFALPTAAPPDDWPVRTYVTAYTDQFFDSRTRRRLFPANRLARFVKTRMSRARDARWAENMAKRWLATVIRTWRPHIIHTLGLDPAGDFYFDARRKFELQRFGKWVLQTRGGSDLALTHLNPELQESIGRVLRECDQLLSDNCQNFRIARELGVREDQLSRIGTVPGTGGIDIDLIASKSTAKPSDRRIILWPKVYEVAWSKALPVYEALKLAWNQIQPCELRMLAMTDEARTYYWTLPESIRLACRVRERVPRAEALAEMTQARVMLAPSLVDGTPNSMFEAMAAGALPIVSPLETITPIVSNERNVLFARNLYPHEIAGALIRAMTDDALVDAAANENLKLVKDLADRNKIRARVVSLYEELSR